jgi:hypothetical protein
LVPNASSITSRSSRRVDVWHNLDARGHIDTVSRSARGGRSPVQIRPPDYPEARFRSYRSSGESEESAGCLVASKTYSGHADSIALPRSHGWKVQTCCRLSPAITPAGRAGEHGTSSSRQVGDCPVGADKARGRVRVAALRSADEARVSDLRHVAERSGATSTRICGV